MAFEHAPEDQAVQRSTVARSCTVSNWKYQNSLRSSMFTAPPECDASSMSLAWQADHALHDGSS